MAYNPFNIFRRNQKAIFAVVTVVIMFMFVLSSGMTGKADFFNWLPEWLNSKKSRGDALCTIEGTKVFPRDVEALRFQRVVANKFMQRAAFETVESMRKALLDLSAQASPDNEFIFKMVLQARNQSEFMQFANFASRVKDNPKSKQADKDAANVIDAMANLMRSNGQITNIPLTNDRDMIEFMLWQQKAKQLGIQFSSDEAKALIQKEFMGNFKSDVNVRQALREEYKERYSDDLLFQALASEFEVRSAYTAIVGLSIRGDSTLTAPPIFTPPYELFDYYREKTSPTSYQLLRVPVESFLPLVKEVPSEADLQRLFSDRKDYEPDPAKEESGFRDPRKVKVEWISVTGDEPYYKKLAAEWMLKAEQLAKSEVRGLIVPIPGMGPAAWAAHFVAPGTIKEPLVFEKYKRDVVDRHESRVRLGWTGPTTFVMPFDVLETSTVKPQNLVAAVGGAAGGTGIGNPFLPASLLYSATVASEQRARIKACMPIVLGAIPGPAMLQTMIGGEVAFRKNIPEPLTLEAYKPELLKELAEGKARELAVNDLKKLKESIDALKETGKSRDSAAKDLVVEFLKVRGVKTGASTEFQGEFAIGEDPGLAPLKAIKDKGVDGMDPHSGMRGSTGNVQFGQKFFWNINPFSQAKEPGSGTYKPEFYPERAAETATSPFGKPEPVFLAWRTAEQPAKGLSFTEAKPRVIEAWKRIKARELAKAEAERLANELRAKPGESEVVIRGAMADMQAQLQAKNADPKVQDKVKLFRVDNVAPFTISRDASGMNPGESLGAFRVTATAEIPYPTPEMSKVLLDERTKPVKTVLVQIDQPKDSYYVVALIGRRERIAEEFRSHVFGGLQRNPIGSQIMDAYKGASFMKAHETILTLLKREFKYVETDEQKKKLEDREKNRIEE